MEPMDLDVSNTAINSTRQQRRRTEYTPAELNQQRARAAEYQRRRRANLTTEQQNLIRRQNATRARLRRQQNGISAQQPAEHTRRRSRRAAMTNEQRQTENYQMVLSQQVRIAQENTQERQNRLVQLSLNQQIRLSQETDLERQSRLARLTITNHASQQAFQQAPVVQQVQRRAARQAAAPLPPSYKSAFYSLLPIAVNNLGSMSLLCNHCGAAFFQGETVGSSCCQHGSITLPPFSPIPQLFLDLFTSMEQQAKRFRKSIRKYNTALSFASLGANVQGHGSGGPFIFKVHGTVYHNQSSLLTSSGSRPAFGQLYILDEDEALQERLSFPGRNNCDAALMHALGHFLSLHNPFSYAYKHMHQVYLEAEESARAQGLPTPNLRLWLHQNDAQNQNRYNLPANDQVAIIFESLDGQVPEPRDILVHSHHQGNLTIPSTSPFIDPLLYPLFFPLGQVPSDRPDVVARVFDLKVKELLKDIVKGQIFGSVAAYTYSIEFQKRGLPHMHLLVILQGADKISDNIQQINSIIQAEIPDALADPLLYEQVKQHMVHGPCGARCLVPNGCKKRFPRNFQEATEVTPNGYPKYMRKNTVHSFIFPSRVVDNRWIVPYNRFLLLKYQAHINVEVCSSIRSVKYIYKYIYKGHDRASAVISTGNHQVIIHDEIQDFLDTRYIAAPEAAWRLQAKLLNKSSHAVIQLAVHLPGQQFISFHPGQENHAVQAAQNRNTHLTAWFQLNQDNLEANNLSYTDIPKYYVFSGGKWTPRRRGTKVIGRMSLVSPRQGERFFLRMLLLHVKGAKNFNDLYCFQGQVHDSFQAAAAARGLLSSDSEWQRTLTEAISLQMPRQLRQLFCMILVFCNPSNPLFLWLQFKEFLCQGIRSTEFAEDIVLSILARKLSFFQLTLANFSLPEPRSFNENHFEDEDFAPETLLQQPSLNQEQEQVCFSVLAAIRAGNGGCFFLEGAGGTGKTFLYNAILRQLQQTNLQVLSVATTGIAATLLLNGRTAHSVFKIPIPTTPHSVSSIHGQSSEAQKIRSAGLIIWDEAPMAHIDLFQAVNRLLQDLMQNTLPFGGKVILLGGDFKQILPVVKHGSRASCVAALISKCPDLWQHFIILRLTQNMRTNPAEIEFSNWLLQVGTGMLNTPQGTINIPANNIYSGTNFIQQVFGEAIQGQGDLSKCAILCSSNHQALAVNEKVLEMLPGENHQYLSSDQVVTLGAEDSVIYPTEFINQMTPSGMPPHCLNLKVGSIVMLLRNLNIASGLCNGTRLKVVHLGSNLITASMINGPRSEELVFLPRISLQPSDTSLPFKFNRKQFPVRLSYAMTINKAQGQTFDRIGLDLEQAVFTHGQLYVALSRCKSLDSIIVKLASNETSTKNVHPPGTVRILPSSFVGSPRYMQQQFQDAMAMVVKCGKPDLFITFTTNPKWPEIVAALLPGQVPSDRPDVISRVFDLKVKGLLKDIVQGETSGSECCQHGAISLSQFSTPPPFLQHLLSSTDQQSKQFRANIRKYNTLFSFASLGANVDEQVSRGPYVFKVHGTIYHNQSSILTREGRRPAFAQLYILDEQEALQERLQGEVGAQLSIEVMQQLGSFISQNNPFAAAYKQMHQVHMEAQAQAVAQGLPTPRIRLWLHQDSIQDRNRYNLPSNNNVAIIFESVDGNVPTNRDIVVHSFFQGQETIPSTSPSIDPLLYPIFFPTGDPGWTYGMAKNNTGRSRATISIREYYTYRLAIRPHQFSAILHGGRLFQQFLVDVYCRVEANRLNYLRLNQDSLRVDRYQGLLDYIQGDDHDNPPGVVRILPSSFVGSPRYMQQQFQDAMAMVVKCGKPDLFITFTTNPKWPEIVAALLPGQVPSDRPDVVARVFDLKVKQLLSEITKGQIFGAVSAFTFTIEFQKRGLPHMHLLVILEGQDKIYGDPEHIDSLIQAEIPNPNEDATLFLMVKQHMVHGPCGIQCITERGCRKHFPKRFFAATQVPENGYPFYRRREGGPTITFAQRVVDSRWIVPYNRYLLLRFNAHINVEVCSSISSVKYLYKYIYKGHDRASAVLSSNGQQQQNYDEIRRFLDTRYVAGPEAAWRLQAKKLNKTSHAIIQLAVHLPGQQSVFFQAGQEQEALQAAQGSHSHLTAWFVLNQQSPEANQYFYTDIPKYYVFNQRRWVPRRRGTKIIGRMSLVSPRQGERFFLRLLLLHVKGAKSYNDLKIFQGIQHSTFQAAAAARGLLASNEEWQNTLREAVSYQMPRQLRQLFSMILVFGNPPNAISLWQEFKEFLCHGIQPNEFAEDIVLRILEYKLLQFQLTLADFALPQPTYIIPADYDLDQVEEQQNLQYLSYDEFISADDEDAGLIPTEFMNALTPSSLPPHCLNLKVGSIVMLLRNLNLSMGLCNGTRLQVVQMGRNIITASLLNGPKNMRTGPGEAAFADWLVQLGNGFLNLPQGDFCIQLPANIIYQGSTFTQQVFGQAIQQQSDLSKTAILCSTNNKALGTNEEVLAMIPGTHHQYLSCDKVVPLGDEDTSIYPLEFLHQLTPSGLPPHCLNLKVGSIVMLLRNLNISSGLCNGSRLRIQHLGQNIITACLLNGPLQNNIVFLPRITLQPSDSTLPFKISRKQFPVRLSYAMTINKAQGQTFERIGLNLEQPVFTHGQLYVAFSRCEAANGPWSLWSKMSWSEWVQKTISAEFSRGYRGLPKWGHDRASAVIAAENPQGIIHDEIKLFLDTRYIAAPEAAWRLQSKTLNKTSHAVIQLAVHLPAKSYQDLRTVNNRIFPTFLEAAAARGLLDSDGVLQQTLLEAISFQMPRQLRQLFTMILVFCNPSNPLSLWLQFKQYLCQNIHPQDQAEEIVLQIISRKLSQFQLTLADFALPQPTYIIPADYDLDQVEEQQNLVQQTLNQEQQLVFEAILQAISNGQGGSFFLHGA
ncbi:hypothetical protein B566_EDAN018479, partial [Ephemera danica]